MKPINDQAALDFLNGSTTPATSAVISNKAITDPATVASLEYGFDFKRPVEAVRADIGKLPAEKRKKALDTWADIFVGTERKGGIGQTINDTVRNFSRGTPVGSWLDEANALTASVFGTPYDEAVAYQRATDRAVDKDSTKLGSLPVIGDVTAGGVQQLAGGLLSAPFAPIAQVFRGGTMLPQMANVGLSGAGYGAVYGAGEGETGVERTQNAAMGGAVGGLFGAAAPPVARGVSNAAGYVADRYKGLPQQLQRYEPQAVRNVQRGLIDDGLNITPPGAAQNNYATEAARLGDQGLLADMGSNLRGQAERIAQLPGRGRQIVTDAIEGRREGATARITGDMDFALGPPANVPASIEATRQQANQIAAPLYQQFEAQRIMPTNRLNDVMQRVPDSAFAEARRLAAADGIPIRTHRTTGGWEGREVDYIKRAIDDMASMAERSGERSASRTWGNLARDIRTEVDTILSPNDPAMSVWAQARRAAGEGLQFEEAAQMGQTAFSKRLAPEQMAADLAGMTPHQRQAYEIGARDQVRSAMGNASTAFGPNGDTAARTMLQSDFARDKLNQIVGPQQADRLNRRIGAETTFAETEQEVLRNAATARRLAGSEMYPAPLQGGDSAAQLRGGSLAGFAAEGVARIANALRSGAMSERNARIATDAARMLMAQGMRRDRIAAALMQYAQSRGLTQQGQAAIERMANSLLAGARQGAVIGATDAP